ncbi:MAG: mannosyltransferase family protein [Leptolyngbya sp. BL-A-14]
MKTFQKPSQRNGLLFVLVIWLLSRLVIIAAMQLFAPLAFTTPVHPEWQIDSSPPGFVPGYIPHVGWELFSHWDSKWYRSIATDGYEYVNDGQQHSIAFFPLFPLVARAVMALGLPFEIAGTLVSNLALLGTLMILYVWVADSRGAYAAKWVAAVMVWCPSSLFGTVIYTEGLFLFVTTAALKAFDQHHYRWAAFWGALASATRIFGIGLIPTFLFVAWRESRPPIAYVAGLITSSGLLLFCLYSTIQFGDPLAFFHAQQGWEHESLLEIVKNALTLDQDSLFSVFALLGSVFVLWHLRSKMPPVTMAYGVFSLLLIISAVVTSGISTASLPRYLYGIVSVSVGLGLWFARHPRWWGYIVLCIFAIFLFQDAFHFAGWDFVG